MAIERNNSKRKSKLGAMLSVSNAISNVPSDKIGEHSPVIPDSENNSMKPQEITPVQNQENDITEAAIIATPTSISAEEHQISITETTPEQNNVTDEIIQPEIINSKKKRPRYELIPGEIEVPVTLDCVQSIYDDLSIYAISNNKTIKQIISEILLNFKENNYTFSSTTPDVPKGVEYTVKTLKLPQTFYTELRIYAKKGKKTVKQLINEILIQFHNENIKTNI